MRKSILVGLVSAISIFLIIVVYVLSAEQYYVAWSITVGGDKDDEGWFIMVDNKSVIVTGYTSSFGSGGKDVWLIKLDENGNQIWNKTYGGEGNEYGKKVIPTGDGGYLIVGSTTSYGNGGSDVWLIRIDGYGNEIWNRTYGEEYDEVGRDVDVFNNDFIVVGWEAPNTGKKDGLIMRVDSLGNIVWSGVFGYENDDWFNDVEVTDDGYIIAVGHTESKDSSTFAGFAIKVNINASIVWMKNLACKDSTGFSCVDVKGDSYIVVGYKGVFGSGRDDLLLVELDADGEKTFMKTFGGSYEDAGVWLCISQDMKWCYTVGNRDAGKGNYDVWVVKWRL